MMIISKIDFDHFFKLRYILGLPLYSIGGCRYS